MKFSGKLQASLICSFYSILFRAIDSIKVFFSLSLFYESAWSAIVYFIWTPRALTLLELQAIHNRLWVLNSGEKTNVFIAYFSLWWRQSCCQLTRRNSHGATCDPQHLQIIRQFKMHKKYKLYFYDHLIAADSFFLRYTLFKINLKLPKHFQLINGKNNSNTLQKGIENSQKK